MYRRVLYPITTGQGLIDCDRKREKGEDEIQSSIPMISGQRAREILMSSEGEQMGRSSRSFVEWNRVSKQLSRRNRVKSNVRNRIPRNETLERDSEQNKNQSIYRSFHFVESKSEFTTLLSDIIDILCYNNNNNNFWVRWRKA